MTDRDESDPRPADESKDRSIDRTEECGSSGGLYERDRLIAQLLLRNDLVDAQILAEVQAELADQPSLCLLALLADRGEIERDRISAIASLAEMIQDRSASQKQSIDDTQLVTDTDDPASNTITFAPISLKDFDPDRQFGDYEIIEEIAKGGMGVVYKARQTKLNRIVALKMIRSGELADQQQIDRFYTEAEAAAKLEHPGIVPVYEVGETAGQHYYSMAYVEGESLDDRVKRDGPLQSKMAAEIIRDAARAVHHAHNAEVVHRDIKPANILLDQSGQSRVTDFGLAKLQQADTEMTAAGQVLGTPAYMPPEQAAGRMEDVGVAADVYSMGATLYFLLTGRPPFQSANLADTLRQVIEDEPVAPRQLTPSIPRDLETICLKAIRKEADKRYVTANDLANDLERCENGEPIRARRVSRAERAWKWCKRKPVIVGSIATIVTLLVVGSIVFWERQNATHVDGLVSTLVNADAAQVPPLIDELNQYRWWSEPRLRARLKNAREGSVEELHLSLALLATDPEQAETLLKHLHAANPDHVELIRAGLSEEVSPEVVDRLWTAATDTTAIDTSRLNAACVLAGNDTDQNRWAAIQNDVARQLVESLARSPRDYDALVSMLRPLRVTLAEPLGRVFRDPSLTPLQQETALNVLVEYAVDQPSVLCDVAMAADAATLERLFSLIEPLTDEAVPLFTGEIARSLDETDDQLEKERIGQRQANAAIALFRLSQADSALPLLGCRRDPRGGSWFIDRVDEYAVPPDSLLDGLDLQASGEEALMVQMSLLQVLGQFDEEQLPRTKRDELIPELLDAYRDHPDPGLHGSLAWLLRQWGQSESMLAADVEMQLDTNSEEANSDEANADPNPRRWYVNTQGQTMTIFDAGEFMMGTPPDSDPDVQSHELYHLRRINRTIAIASTEVTKAQFREFEQGKQSVIAADDLGMAELARTEDSPMSAVTWYEAAWYCNWLSEREGIPQDQWCYSPFKGEYGPGMRIKENFWELAGYRLPTEAEWEYTCRAGSDTRYGYGYAESLLPQYARYEVNGEGHQWPVGYTLPNALGLFDMHGNVYEWCQGEIDGDYSKAERIEEEGVLVAIVDESNCDRVADSTGRVLRGGAFNSKAPTVRSAYRSFYQPSNRHANLGFRVARTYHLSP